VAVAASAFLSDGALHGLATVALVLFGLIVVLYAASLLYATKTTKGRAAVAHYEARRASRK
jgi:hypothetical protein